MKNGLSDAFSWSTGPDFAWVIDDTVAYSGSKSMRNVIPPSGNHSELSLTIETNTGGVLTYQIRHDVFMPWNVAYVKNNGEYVENFQGHTGDVKWELHEVIVEKGFNKITWSVWSSDNKSLPPKV